MTARLWPLQCSTDDTISGRRVTYESRCVDGLTRCCYYGIITIIIPLPRRYVRSSRLRGTRLVVRDTGLTAGNGQRRQTRSTHTRTTRPTRTRFTTCPYDCSPVGKRGNVAVPVRVTAGEKKELLRFTNITSGRGGRVRRVRAVCTYDTV